MKNRSVIITGANSGLGFECAKAIAKAEEGWHIVMACRNIENGNQAKARILSLKKDAAITVMKLDLASMDSIRAFVVAFTQAGLPLLQGLINNAGLQVMSGLEYTADGFELTFGTNHLGHFLLTVLLVPHIKKPGRIIVVSSGTHDPDTMEGRFNKPVFLGAKQLAYPKSEKEMSGMQRYATSKLANLMFAYRLSARLKNHGITVNAFDPAAVPATNLLQSIRSPLIRSLLRFFTRFSGLLGVKLSTPEISGGAMARLLLDGNLRDVTGKYFQILEQKVSSEQSYDEALAEQLWKDSLTLTGIETSI